MCPLVLQAVQHLDVHMVFASVHIVWIVRKHSAQVSTRSETSNKVTSSYIERK